MTHQVEMNIKLGKNMLEAICANPGMETVGTIRLNIGDVFCFESTQMFFEYVIIKWSERLKINIDFETLKKNIVLTNDECQSDITELHYFKNLHKFIEANKYFKKEQEVNGDKYLVKYVPTYSIDCAKLAFVEQENQKAGGGASA